MRGIEIMKEIKRCFVITVIIFCSGCTSNEMNSDTKIAFVSYRNGNADIYQMALLEGVEEQLTHTQADETSPDWSPDGKSLVYVSNEKSDETQIYILNLISQETVQLTTKGRNFNPKWSPCGNSIAFNSWTNEEGLTVKIIDLNSNIVQIVVDKNYSPELFSWDEDCRGLYFSSDVNIEAPFVNSIFYASLQQNDISLIIDESAKLGFYNADLSPDGAFAVANSLKPTTVFIFPLDGTQQAEPRSVREALNKLKPYQNNQLNAYQPTWVSEREVVLVINDLETGEGDLFHWTIETDQLVQLTDHPNADIMPASFFESR